MDDIAPASPRNPPVTEQTPLLAETVHTTPSYTDSGSLHNDMDKSALGTVAEVHPRPPAGLSRKNIIWITVIAMIDVFTVIADSLKAIPLYQVLEEIICRDVSHGQPVEDCGNNKEAQAEMAYIIGWFLTLAMLPGILTAVPYGYFADKHGKKLGMMLAVTGMFLQDTAELSVYWFPDIVPVRAIWLTALPLFIGGGPYVLTAINLSLLSKLATETYRSSVFFYYGAALAASSILATAITATLMQKDLWLPVYIGIGMSVPVTVMPFLLPKWLFEDETPAASVEAGQRSTAASDGDSHDAAPAAPAAAADASGQHGRAASLRQLAAQTIDDLTRSARFFLQTNRNAALLLATLLVTTMGKHSEDIMLQYVRSRYGWSWAETGYLRSFKSLVGILLLMVLLPGANFAFRKLQPGLAPRVRDFFLARVSLCFSVAGCISIAMAPTSMAFIGAVFLYSLGGGYPLLVKSLLATVVPPTHHGLLFSTTGMMESLDAMLAGPLVAAAFREGLALGGVWRGLPYMVATVLLTIAMVATGFITLPPALQEEEE